MTLKITYSGTPSRAVARLTSAELRLIRDALATRLVVKPCAKLGRATQLPFRLGGVVLSAAGAMPALKMFDHDARLCLVMVWFDAGVPKPVSVPAAPSRPSNLLSLTEG